MREHAHLAKDALVLLEEVELAKLSLGLLCFWKGCDRELVEAQLLEVFVHEAVSQVLLVGALAIGVGGEAHLM